MENPWGDIPLPWAGSGRWDGAEGEVEEKWGAAALLSGPGVLAAAASHDCQRSVKNLPKSHTINGKTASE